jgi:L-threonylcarbamoyladenylate synthase
MKTLISTSSHDAAALLNKMKCRHSYGNGLRIGNAFSEKKRLKDFRIKKKTFYNPLIVHIKSVADLNQIALKSQKKQCY